jgi:hypothetical protein
MKEGELGGTCSTHGWRRDSYRILVVKDEDLIADGKITLKYISLKYDVREWTGLILLRIGFTDCYVAGTV